MILSMAYLKGLIKKGQAGYVGGSEPESIVNHNNGRYVAIVRWDIQRIDHYEIS